MAATGIGTSRWRYDMGAVQDDNAITVTAAAVHKSPGLANRSFIRW